MSGSKIVGGSTPFGRDLNKSGSQSTDVLIRQTPRSRYGRIVGIQKVAGDNAYNVILWLVDIRTDSFSRKKREIALYQNNDKKTPLLTKPIQLVHHPIELASIYGDPQSLQGRYICRIDYTGPSYNRGKATIVADLTQDVEQTAKYNQLDVQGASFAPPGAGM